MKKINIGLKYTSAFILLVLIQFELTSCPRCNQSFYDELLSERGNTLAGQELLQAIRNQQVPGQPSNFVLPAAYNNLTDIKESNNQDTAELNGKNSGVNNQPSAQTNYYSYIYIIVQLMFPGNLFA